MRASRAAFDSPVLPGDLVGGKYEIEKRLGVGGMGIVVSARHGELGRPVALKFLLPELLGGSHSTERFVREARQLAVLRSEHIARVYDFGFHAGKYPYMVLELLEGKDLLELQREKESFAVPEAVEYVMQALAGLSDAHAAGIVHRDLKPENLFVTKRSNGSPLVKLLDFGLAKSTGDAARGLDSLTHASAVMGSPLYMSPEQIRAARFADQRSDIWAMGVILYELLGGQRPFGGASVMEICLAVATRAPKPLVSLRPIDPALDAIVMKCLEKDPSRRWQSVEDLAEVLAPHSRPSWARIRSTATLRLPAISSTPPVPAKRSGFAKGLAFGLGVAVVAVTAALVGRTPPPDEPLTLPEPPTLTSASLPVAQPSSSIAAPSASAPPPAPSASTPVKKKKPIAAAPKSSGDDELSRM